MLVCVCACVFVCVCACVCTLYMSHNFALANYLKVAGTKFSSI